MWCVYCCTLAVPCGVPPPCVCTSVIQVFRVLAEFLLDDSECEGVSFPLLHRCVLVCVWGGGG